MCVVAIKPQGVHRPTDEMFMNMCTRNRDGFGMVYWKEGQGLIVKKTMSEEEYLKWVQEIDDDTPAIFHMRIATHGSVSKKNCHPFVSKRNDWAFAHNGILSIDNEKDMTDSETFFRRIALPMIDAGHTPCTKTFDAMVATIIGSSKFAFMDDKGQIYTYGNYVKHESGLMFSNSSYESYKPIPTIKSVFEDWNGYSGNYQHDYCGYGGNTFGKPSDKEDDINACYDDLYNSLWYDSGYYEGMTDSDMYEEFGRTYSLSRAAFKNILKTVRDIIVFDEENIDKQYSQFD